MVRNNSVYIKLLLLVGIVATFVLLVFNTNVFYKQPGTNFTRSISFISDSSTDGGFVQIKRDERTPSAMDWVRFVDNEQVSFFTSRKGVAVERDVIVSLPDVVESGNYYVVVHIDYMYSPDESKVIKFRVI